MNNYPDTRVPIVCRITVDEKLADGLIRILITELKNDVVAFNDDPVYWGEEEELLVMPDNYQERMGMTWESARKWHWESLCEGQVFLQGRFRMESGQLAQQMFVVDMEQWDFQRIDPLIRGRLKNEYLAALERSVPDGETNQTG